MTGQPDGLHHVEEMIPKLRALLRERLGVIADHALRERDPAAQLARLGLLSGQITALHETWRASLPARLSHFLDQASFQKALDFIGDGGD